MAMLGSVSDRVANTARKVRRTLSPSIQTSRTSWRGSARSSFHRRTATSSPERDGGSAFSPQPFFTTGQFTSLMGKRGSLADAIAGCRRFLHDEFEDLPERRAP